jgi:hypothetical protein
MRGNTLVGEKGVYKRTHPVSPRRACGRRWDTGAHEHRSGACRAAYFGGEPLEFGGDVEFVELFGLVD